jgi:hypothetical protein
MSRPFPHGLVFLALLALFLPESAIASRPGGGAEGPPQCTVMGEVIRLEPEPPLAVVRLREIAGSTTYAGCAATGAEGMTQKQVSVKTSLDIVPAPVIATGDVVFVNVGEAGNVSLETFAPGEYTLDLLLREVQIYFEDRLQRLKFVYAIKSYLGAEQTVEELVPRLIEADGEKRLSAALMLIVLADARQGVPPDALQRALRIGLMESRKSAVGASIGLYPGDRDQTVNVLLGLLRDPEVQDPFATIVGLGELGPVAARAVPAVIDRLNDPRAAQIRSDGDRILATAIEKMKAKESAAKIFLAKAREGKLRDPEGPLAKGMCLLTDAGPLAVELAGWCAGGK